ncbi:MAG TPA: hypothetical protein VFZ59_03880, partial [Verrucomicrobiae bacterium]|nr:hypothetical protein [Verrucomicrobiae bacterium]
TWQAVSVPLNVNNMQVMLVQAYPTGSNPLTTPSTVELREMSDAPPSVKQTGWHLNTYNNATNYEIINLQQVWFHEITSVAENWTEGVGGEKSRYRWKQYLVSGNTFECTNYASLPTNMMGLVEGFPIQDTCNGATTTTLNPYLQHFEDVSGANFARVDAMTTLFANGQDIPGATRAVLLEVQAGIYGGDFKPEEVFLHGKPLSPSAEDPFVGQMLVMLPQGAALDAVPQVPSSANAFNYSIQSKEVKVILKSVTFSTNLSYQLFRDDVFSGFYPIPHWTPTNSSPVAFASGTRMEAQLDISITNIPTNTSLVFKGETGRGITFWGTNSVSGTNLSVTVIADYALATNKVDFFNPLTIQWSVTFPGETRFLNIGTSTNQIYVTLRAPSLDFYLLRHTLAHLACANPGATNDDQAVANTWSFFAGPANVKTWNGLPLTYYGTPSGGSNVTFLKLLERRDGQCYAFGELLYAAFKMNGITNAVWTSVRAPFELQGFGIKKIEFDTNNPAYPSEPIFKFAETNLNITIPDIPGQNTNPPQAKLFEEHIVLKRGGLFYDPSYGTTTTSATAYTTNVAAWKRSDERWRNADGSTNILLFIP